MLLHIAKEQLKPGMFVEAVECPVAEFSRRRFLLTDPTELAAIQATSAVKVLINTRAGQSKPRQSGAKRILNDDQALAAAAPELLRTTVDQLKESIGDLRESQTVDMDRIVPAAGIMQNLAVEAPNAFQQLSRMRTKNESTFQHSIAVGGLMAQVGNKLGYSLEMQQELATAGLLHDIGKNLMPNSILDKNGRLTQEELVAMREHPKLGYDLLRRQPEISEIILDVCHLHHESLDGKGYPLGLKGRQISMQVRIATVCDVFDALTSLRPYKKPWTTQDALNWMFERSEKFDRKVVLKLAATVG
ncbi:MAG: hypothetical protein RLZZ444_1400 [Pseudomonadota bacterium]